MRLARVDLGMMEVMCLEDEDDLFFFDEESEQNVENIMPCSFAHYAHNLILQEFLHEEELCKVARTCHFALDADLSLSRLNTGAFCVTRLDLWQKFNREKDSVTHAGRHTLL